MTIYALSSGQGIAGISVIRVSGPETKNIIKKLTDYDLPSPELQQEENSIKSTQMS